MTTASVLGSKTVPSEVAGLAGQGSAVAGDIDLIGYSAGGNDVDFKHIVLQCILLRDQFAASRLAAELGCGVTPHPGLARRVEAWDPLPGLRVVVGTPDAVRAEVRRGGLCA